MIRASDTQGAWASRPCEALPPTRCPVSERAGRPFPLTLCVRHAGVGAAFLFAAVVLLSLASLRAGDDLEFAVPDDGLITLGVFDSSGKLARTLHQLAKEEDFRTGLNGLITSWDGKNDAGERVASGHYHVRGYLIGEGVRVSGENFLFNDWAADPGFPGFERIGDFSLLENGDVILLASVATDGNLLARFSPDKGFLWSCKIVQTVGGLSAIPVFRQTGSAGHLLDGSAASRLLLAPSPRFPPLLAANSSTALVVTEEGAGLHALDDGKKIRGIRQEADAPPLALAANDSCMFTSFRGVLAEAVLPDLSPASPAFPPSPFTSMDADGSALIGASPDGAWIRKGSFTQVALPTAAKSVSLGTPGTFWFVGVENGTTFVGQASFGGEILRLLRPAGSDPKPEKIRASRTAEKFAVLESLPGLQRLRVMARAESGEWTIEWERTLHESETFGFVDGMPTANTGGAAQEKNLRYRLKENPLTGKHDFLAMRAEFDASGSRLVSPDGLPLVEVSSRPDIRRVVIHRGDKPDTLRLLQGNGSFAEEFSISGLDDILPLDAGGIDIP